MKPTWLLIGILATATAHAQTTLYSDDFSGNGGLLNGAAVDISNGLSTNWIANSAFLDDGTTDGSLSGSALLDVSLQPNAQYNLSVDIGVNAVGGDWGGFGFASGDAATFIGLPGADGGNDDRFTDGPGGRSWALLRDIDGALNVGDVEYFGGAGAANGFNADDTLDIVANTTYDAEMQLITAADGSSYTVELFINGASVLDGDSGLGTPRTITDSIALIGSVGLTFNNTLTTGHTFDNFLLTEQVLGAPDNVWKVDGGGNFNDSANWSENTVPTSKATFGAVLTAANSPATVTLDSPVSLNNIVFSNGVADYIINGGNTLTMIGDADVSTVGRHWLSVDVAGSAGLTKSGAGELILDAGNSFNGALTVNDGRVSVTHPSAIPAGANVDLVATTSNLLFGGDNGFFVENGATGGGYVGGTVDGVISGTGSVIVTLGAKVTFTGANTHTGTTTIEGTDTVLTLSGSGTLGASDGTAASETRIGGAAQLTFQGKAIGNEVLKLDERANEGTPAHLSTGGTSSWAGNIFADTPGEGSHYKIESTSGTLTLGGTISAFDDVAPNDRYYVFDTAAGSTIAITGAITDYATDANGDFLDADMNGTPDTNAGDNVHVIKRGPGTLNISTGGQNTIADQFNFHRATTVIEEGTLAVIDSQTANAGELYTSRIEVHSGAVFDTSAFTTYNLQVTQDPDGIEFNGDEIGQTLAGTGTIDTGAGTLGMFEDSVVEPGTNNVGTLTVDGTLSISSTQANPNGGMNFDLANVTTTGSGVNDLLDVDGALTLNASGGGQHNLRVTPVSGSLASGPYTIITANSRTGSATGGNFDVSFTDQNGNALNPRQTGSVTVSGNNVTVSFAGAAAARTWNGTAGNSTWDVNTSTNWTGGDSRFRDLDNVTFGSGGTSKDVVLETTVSPGSTLFNSVSTYTFTGSGGITGYGPVNVNAGTVKLHNTANDYRGATTVASGATLETVSASTGDVTINGTLVLGKPTATTIIDDFSGDLSSYTNTVILDTDTGGGANTAAWQITGGAAEYNTTTYQSIEQSALVRSGLSLAVGEELIVDVAHSGDSQDIGLYVGGTTPVAGTRQDYVSVYARNDGQLYSRGFDGTTEYGLVGGGAPEYTSLFVARTGENTFEAGFYDATGRNVITTRTPATANEADVIGFYTDVRAAGVLGSVDNLRILELGGTATLDVNGDFDLSSSGVLEVDIMATGFDSLDISGMATLTGEIAVLLEEGLQPADGTQYTILSAAGGIATALGSLDFGDGLPSGFSASYDDSMTDLILTFSAGLGGDFNGDGIVNIADYTVWRNNLGADETVLPAGTASGNGVVDEADYTLWKDNFGMTAAALSNIASASANVPEPTSFVLIAGLVAGGFFALRRRGIGQHSTV
ncbi:beta strand repeat-containing protein [Aeoliella sp.]|uniref:beta strand repeat-containing protein n=1 Tax=Aeoliella sp. TaxID=2795800 RepID=UPI003CCC06C5